jgi:hypothetical protein
MSERFSLDDFRKVVPANAETLNAPVPSPISGEDSECRLTRAGQEFRRRFCAALDGIEIEAASRLAKATKRAEAKTIISVAAVAKRAKASPLSAYSPLHRDALIPRVEAAIAKHEAALSKAFKRTGRKTPTVAALTSQLRQERARHEEQIRALASQKFSDMISAENARTS